MRFDEAEFFESILKSLDFMRALNVQTPQPQQASSPVITREMCEKWLAKNRPGELYHVHRVINLPPKGAWIDFLDGWMSVFVKEEELLAMSTSPATSQQPSTSNNTVTLPSSFYIDPLHYAHWKVSSKDKDNPLPKGSVESNPDKCICALPDLMSRGCACGCKEMRKA